MSVSGEVAALLCLTSSHLDKMKARGQAGDSLWFLEDSSWPVHPWACCHSDEGGVLGHWPGGTEGNRMCDGS